MEFLSEEWFTAQEELWRANKPIHPPYEPFVIDLVIDGSHYHFDNTKGEPWLKRGPSRTPHCTICCNIELARRTLLEGDWESLFDAYLDGTATITIHENSTLNYGLGAPPKELDRVLTELKNSS